MIYTITDNSGRMRTAWTRAGAFRTLRECGPGARIYSITGRLIARQWI